MNNKKGLCLIGLAALLVSCGGGGGGGGSTTNTPTPTPTNPTVTKKEEPTYATSINGGVNAAFNSSGNIQWNGSTGYNASNPHNHTNTAYNGSGVKVGIIDTGFNNSAYSGDLTSELGTRYENVNTTNTTLPTDNHGVIIAKLVGGTTSGVAKGVSIVAADATVVSGSSSSINPTAAMYETLYNKGVRIYNQSFGSEGSLAGFTTDTTSSNYFGYAVGTDILDFYKKAVNNGSLLVWAAGNNSSQTYSTLQGTLPHWEPSLQQGWLNVVGLTQKGTDANKGNMNLSWNNLQPYSHAGAAKNWTVSAIADYTTTIGGTNVVTFGSSNATATVSGTAALIKQKYPFMDGSLLRQTILSTATDIGDPGVDDVYGWGLLNIDKALNGPALFDKRLALGDAVSVNITDGGTYVFSNDISGDAGLTLTGNGTLKLTGNSTFTGNTSVASGSHLYINGGYRSSSVAVAQNATLSTQNANVSGNVTNSGTISNTGNTTLSSYVATDNSKIESDLDSRINVKGKAELGNSTIAIKAEKDGEAQYVTAKGKKVNVITSDTEVTGNPTVTTTEALKSEKTQDGNSVDVKVSRKNVNEYVKEIDGDQMQKDTAEGLEASLKDLDEKVENNNDESVKEFKKAAAKLQTMSSHSALSTLDSLSGQIYASSQALTFEQSQTINKDLTNRLVMLGTMDDSKEKFGLWLSGIGSKGRLKQDGYAKGDTHTYGGQVGIDRKFGDNLILGAALAYSRADVKFDRYGGKSDADSFATSLYGRLGNKNNPLYLQGRIGVGFVDTDVERDILLSSTDVSRQKINHNDRVVSGYLETGYDLKNKEGDFVVTPFVGLSHDSVRRGAFSETNSQFGLTADKKTYDQTSGLVGLRVGKAVRFNNGAKTTLQGYVTHQRAFNDEDLSFDAHYTGLPGTNFTVKGIGLEKSQTWVGVGALTEFNPRMAWYVNYDAKLRSNKNNNNVFTTGLRWSF
jgi:putative serine protease